MREFLQLTKALADGNRLRLLLALMHGELCVCQLTELLGLATSTVSKHLAILYQAGLADSRKEGRWIYYRLPRKALTPAAREALTWVRRALAHDPHAAEDARRLKQVLTLDPVELCRRQCAK